MSLLQASIAVFLIMLALGQLGAVIGGLRGLSLFGSSRVAGGIIVFVLFVGGIWLLPASVLVFVLTVPIGLLTVAVMLVGGSILFPPPHPDRLFSPDHPAHVGCEAVAIPDGKQPPIPGLLLYPHGEAEVGPAVCIVPGAGDTKTSFKWRQVEALLAEGLRVLLIDPPGHGEYRHRPLDYPDCLSVVPAAIRWLRERPDVTEVGLLGVSLGGALSIASLAAIVERQAQTVGGLVIFATPIRLDSSKRLTYQVAWRTFSRVPILSLFREMSALQVRQSWLTGGYRGRYNVAQLLELLQPVENMSRLRDIPTLLVYSRRDAVSTLEMAAALQTASPEADLITSQTASHVTLILLPEINRQIAAWFGRRLASR